MEKLLYESLDYFSKFTPPHETRIGPHLLYCCGIYEESCEKRKSRPVIEPGHSTTISIDYQIPYMTGSYRLFVCIGDKETLLEIEQIEIQLTCLFIETDEKTGDRQLKNEKQIKTYVVNGKDAIMNACKNNGLYLDNPTAICFNLMEDRDIYGIDNCVVNVVVINKAKQAIIPRVFFKLLDIPPSVERKCLFDYGRWNPNWNIEK